MELSVKQIKEIDAGSLEQTVNILRRAFGEVTEEFGITEENAPMYAAFTTVEKVKEMRARGARLFGLFINSVQAGVVALEKRDDGNYYMERLAVLPEYWHGGLGRELVDYVIDYVRKLGATRLRLAMVNEHAVLKKWYQDMGFRDIEVKKYERLPFTVGFMEKDIS